MGLLIIEGSKARKARLEDYVEVVLALVSLVPIGSVTTYSSIARALGIGPRLVGKILSMNGRPVAIPCHRVVRSDGKLGGYRLGLTLKRALLLIEGVEMRGNRVVRDHIIDITGADARSSTSRSAPRSSYRARAGAGERTRAYS